MKNPYLYGYLPLFTILLFSITFGIYTVNVALELFTAVGLYAGMREFLSEIEIKVLLLIFVALCYFMIFSALKLIGETIHTFGMLLFSKDSEGETINVARGGNVIFFLGAIISSFAIQSFVALAIIFALTTIIYFIYTLYKLSKFLSVGGLIGLICFEILLWTAIVVGIIFAGLKLYNGILASLPFAN